MLTPDCNGRCSWCIEKKGYKPKRRVPWQELASQIVRSGRKNIILLGGEPTLYPRLGLLGPELTNGHGLNVYLTTNGSLMCRDFVRSHLSWPISGVNISIHAVRTTENAQITGIKLDEGCLQRAIWALHCRPRMASVRLNCNLIKGYVDSEVAIHRYIAFARKIGAGSVRFAELKLDNEHFISAAAIMDGKFGLNDDPFRLGCQKNCIIDDMPVNFRQMCGLQTTLRPRPDNPVQYSKLVLYYDGLFYPGWQQAKEIDVDKQALGWILDDLKAGRIDKALAAQRIEALKADDATPKGEEDPRTHRAPTTDQGGCFY